MFPIWFHTLSIVMLLLGVACAIIKPPAKRRLIR